MLRRAIPILFCFGLLMTFSSFAGADVLKKKDNGTIVAVGHLKEADEKTIHWETCDGQETAFAPRKEYLYKQGNHDCNRGATNQYPPNEEQQGREASRSHDRAADSAKGDWKPVPVTRH
jgi:hypothetical protein